MSKRMSQLSVFKSIQKYNKEKAYKILTNQQVIKVLFNIDGNLITDNKYNILDSLDKIFDKDETIIVKVITNWLDFFLSDINYSRKFKIYIGLINEDNKKLYLEKNIEKIINIIKENPNYPELSSYLYVFDDKMFNNLFRGEMQKIIFNFTPKDFANFLYGKSIFSRFEFEDEIINDPRFIDLCANIMDKEIILPRIKDEQVRKIIEEKINNNNNEQERFFVDFFETSTDNVKTTISMIKHSSFVDILSKEELDLYKDILIALSPQTFDDIPTLYRKYKELGVQTEKLYDIYNKIRLASTTDIINSLTDISNFPSTIEQIEIDEDIYEIKVIHLNGRKYNFLIRTFYLEDDPKKESFRSFSTISSNNRSTYYGNSRPIHGYSHIRPERIAHVYPFDALSGTTNSKFSIYSSRMPKWCTYAELNDKTCENESYNELIILPDLINPEFNDYDFLVAYDNISPKVVKKAAKENKPVVKIKRLAYPYAIEYHEDPFGDLQ